ncbi:unnamed protein product [Diatraea saccharalis]|uniref:N-acyl-aliphatic-L-amino acid amidohydrolase n=1 Tax=Diatraea saccharalis TaxID=40085 RepID=A0A9N9QXQ5_9NEOP|nr:unnamed protein product [Diatraea saccharalis]
MDISTIMFYVKMWAIGILFYLNAVLCNTVNNFVYDSNPSVALLQKYIQINTTTYNNLDKAVTFWTNLAAAQGVEIKKYVYKPNMPVLVLKWPGTNQSLPGIMLNSHMDVVPASEQDGWLYPPFAGHITQEQDRKIYGRGTQDMKSVSIQYYEALKRLKEKKISLLRTVYMTLMPDEEVGAEAGMLSFLPSQEFKAMNVGFELDEGGALNVPMIPVFVQDKVVWQIQVDCHGVAGHGSSFQPTNATATGKCHNVVTNMFAFRDEQYPLFASAPSNDSSGYTSVNLNRVSGGTANNVVPNVVSLTFDIRPSTKLNEDKLQQMLEEMVYSAGDNITITYISKNPQSPATMANSTNPFWNAIQSAATDLNITLVTAVPPGSTDARHVRLAGVPAFGMAPQRNTPTLLHAVNEYLGVNTFLSGIDFYEKVIKNMASVPANLARNPSSYLYNTTIG